MDVFVRSNLMEVKLVNSLSAVEKLKQLRLGLELNLSCFYLWYHQNLYTYAVTLFPC